MKRATTLRCTYKSMSYDCLNEQEYKHENKRYAYLLNVFPCQYMSFLVGYIRNRFTQSVSHIHQPTYFAYFTPIVRKVLWKVGRILVVSPSIYYFLCGFHLFYRTRIPHNTTISIFFQVSVCALGSWLDGSIATSILIHS
jgi:hypothetical protein